MNNKLKKDILIPLFDIDWTLLRGKNQVHFAAFTYAIETVYKLPKVSIEEISYEGKIDNQIILELVLKHGIPKEKTLEKLPQAASLTAKYFTKHINEVDATPLPGVREILNELKTKNVPVGLLTGNVEQIAFAKLKKAGIDEFFTFGAFGNLAMQRVDLIDIARKGFENSFKVKVSKNRFVIVGDSLRDIACAKLGGIKVIAVSTGDFSKEILEKEKADLVISSFADEIDKQKTLKFLGV